VSKLKFIVPVLLLAALVLVGAGCGKYSSPQKTIAAMIKAMEKGDVDAYIECFTEESRTILEATGTPLTSESIKVDVRDVKDIKFKQTEKKGDRAVLVSEEEKGGALVFTREKGAWKVDLQATMEEAFKDYQQQ